MEVPSPLGWLAGLACPLVSKLGRYCCTSVPVFDTVLFHVFSVSVLQFPPAEPCMGRRHKYYGVLPSAQRGQLVALLSPPQCLAALGTVPHTLAREDYCPC
jgi:hypothetical protein